MEQRNLPREYYNELTRIGENLFSIQTWYTGESVELEKLIGVGMFNTLFISIDNNVTIYYDLEEAERFHKRLKEVLTDSFFDRLCEDFFRLMENAENCNTNNGVYDLLSRCFPILTIFDEISKYPEIASDSIIRRLERIRKETESFAYDLMKKVILIDNPKDYIYHQGKLYVYNR